MERLSPDTLSFLQQFYPGGRNAQQDMRPVQAPDGKWYMPVISSGDDPDGTGSTQSLGWRNVGGASPTMGEQTNFYNSDGTFSSPGVYKEGTSGKGLFDVLGPLSVLAAPFVWPGILSAAGFGGSAGAASGAGGFIGEGAASGIPAWDGAVGGSMLSAGDAFMPGALGVDGAAMSTAPLSGLESYVAGGATGAGGASVAGDMFMPGQLGANYTPGAIPGLEKYATSGIGSAVKGLLPDSAKGWLGLAATIGGGLLGSKPQTQSATSTRTTDPRFDPAINGLLGMLQQQINQPRPANTLGNIAPRGNGFNLFTGR
jgi:hypothetical protein